jgi:DNA-directed RNA polymerase specialized sigma24 family protein
MLARAGVEPPAERPVHGFGCSEAAGLGDLFDGAALPYVQGWCRPINREIARLELPHRTADPGSGADLAAALAAAIAALTERQKQVIGLHYLADLPVVAVAALLHVTEGTIKSTLHDARARLRAALSTGEPP